MTAAHAAAPLLVASAAALLCACGGRDDVADAARGQPSHFAGARLVPVRPAPDFALRDQRGRLIRLHRERGRLVLVTFLYTHCRDVCPLIAANLNRVLLRLGPLRDRVAVLAVSVDPRGDTPAAVRRFVHVHRLLPEFHYLTGGPELEAVWRAYHVAARGGPEVLDHSAFTLLVDRRGDARLVYAADATGDAVFGDVRQLLATGG